MEKINPLKNVSLHFILAKNFMRHEDFFEGVRSVVVDKDQNPNYKYKQLSDVSEEDVNRFFNLLNA